MNFDFMHELAVLYSYLIAFALTLATTFSTLLLMRRRKWL